LGCREGGMGVGLGRQRRWRQGNHSILFTSSATAKVCAG
jgi:hypothetical protein